MPPDPGKKAEATVIAADGAAFARVLLMAIDGLGASFEDAQFIFDLCVEGVAAKLFTDDMNGYAVFMASCGYEQATAERNLFHLIGTRARELDETKEAYAEVTQEDMNADAADLDNDTKRENGND